MSEENYIVVVASETMGEGNNDIGSVLMKSFFSVLAEEAMAPEHILFYNTGINLVLEDSDVLEDLKTLESNGSRIGACGTCLDFFEAKEQVAVGEVSNMKTIVQTMRQYAHVVRP